MKMAFSLFLCCGLLLAQHGQRQVGIAEKIAAGGGGGPVANQISSDPSGTNGTQTNVNVPSSGSVTIAGSKLAIIVGVALNSATATVTAVSWSAGGGTCYDVTSARQVAGTVFVDIWACPAPTAGAGHIAVTFSASVDYQVSWSSYTGTDQTTPASNTDSATVTWDSANSKSTIALTPSNLTSTDGTFQACASTTAGDVTGVTPNQRYLDDTTNINAQSGDNTGTSVATCAWSGTGIFQSVVAVRIKAG